ncbi:MAG: ABC transporter ATP-binding protein, partial [Opitutaceae bacterium]|nr:ABC transporter ATP-binding protein [Opitutaceae bacterium]
MALPSTVPLAVTPSNGELVRRLFRLAWRYWAHCLAVLGIQIVLLTMGIAGLGFTGIGIDYIRHRVLPPGPDGAPAVPLPHFQFGYELPQNWPPMHILGLLAGLILGLAVCRAVLNYVYTVSINKLVQQKLVVDLRGDVYDKLQRLSFRFYDANTTGSIITRVTGDVQAVRMFVDQVLMQSVIMGISLTVYVIYMVSLSPTLTVVCLATTPLLWVMAAWFSRKIQPEYAHNRTLVEKMVQTLAESIQGIAVTKGFGRESEDRARFDTANNAVLGQQRSIFWKVSLFSPAVGLLTRFNMAVLLGYGGWLVVEGKLPLGAGLVVFVGLLEQYSGQVNNVANLVNSVQQSLIGARRVFEILDAPVEVQSAPNAVRRAKLTGAVRFDHVGFSYQGPGHTALGVAEAEPVLYDIDLDVKPGQCVAILG